MKGKKYAVFVEYAPDTGLELFEDKQKALSYFDKLTSENENIPVYMCEVLKSSRHTIG